MSTEHGERLEAEVALLQAMYPEQISYNEKIREVLFVILDLQSSLTLRLPRDYLTSGLPEIISATVKKHDLRNELGREIRQYDCGEEVLDRIMLTFQDLASRATPVRPDDATVLRSKEQHEYPDPDTKATIIVWLHHLLNTNKRKQALSAPTAAVAGVTKPGYPGVLIFSGSEREVHEHVNELKRLNWQAFQIRLDIKGEWVFKHGRGVIELESMGEVVADIGEEKKDVFMEAMRMK